jgi:hypothetical protein
MVSAATTMRFTLISLEHSVTAIRDHMKAHPDDDVPDQEEMQQMCKLAIRFVMTARAPGATAEALSGKPSEN